ncbi:MAG: peptidoglycan DD-metalloendopeptidase family protein [Clostridia bacterium]|nr:peptidoglycan DD-metalloendopeptidase family protein [Clostridia bacterium]
MKKTLKTVSLILCAVTFFALVPMCLTASGVTNDKIKAKQAEIGKLQALLKEQKETSETARENIDRIVSEIEETEKKKASLLNNIDSISNEIDTTNELIKQYGDYIKLKESEISETENDLKKQEEALVEFLRYDYESGSVAVKNIEFLLNSASLSEFLSNIYYIGVMMDYQEHMMQNIENTMVRLESQNYDLNKAKAEKEEYADELAVQQAEYRVLLDKAIEYTVKLDTDQQGYETILEASEDEEAVLAAAIKKAKEEEAKLIAEEKEYQRKLEEERKRKEEEERRRREAEAAAQLAAYGNDGTFMWPLPLNKFTITGWFGYEPNPIGSGIRFHKALDLGSPGGTPIYASASGVVITARYSSSYGYYVMIKHDNGMYTLYAHASKLKVKEGDKVVQGDTIALVGTTGMSTGNHLHFEIILENGKTRTDPVLYFEKICKQHWGDSKRYDELNNPRKQYYTP